MMVAVVFKFRHLLFWERAWWGPNTQAEMLALSEKKISRQL
jgi:hypothetical protein